MESTRAVSSKQEKAIAKALDARRTPNSGATKFDKGDLYLGSEWLIEAKTCMTEKQSFSIKKAWLQKMKLEQYATNKSNSALCFDFGTAERYYIIDENTFINLLEERRNK